MADIAALKAALDDAQAAQDALIAERRDNRENMTRANFRAYNQTTAQQQRDIASAVADAAKALQEGLNEVRADAYNQVVNVGTVSEAGSQGGVS